jgi:hypothetical protein
MQNKITGHTAHLLADVLQTCVQFDYPADVMSILIPEKILRTERFQHYSHANNPYDAHRTGFFSHENGNIVIFPDAPQYALERQQMTIAEWQQQASAGSITHQILLAILEN